MTRAHLTWLVGLLSVTALTAAGDIRVTPLTREGRVLVSFEMPSGFNADMKAAVHSGLPTTFTYEVELRRGLSFWFDRTITSATVTAGVQYDNLTRQHKLSLLIDGRIEASNVTNDEGVVAKSLTSFERLPLFNTTQLEPNGEYYIRVRLQTRPRVGWLFFWPWDRSSASGYAKFTFIP
ncbi:MAG: DUF4390 domain-containing protein [Acidobacteria bacterium]|nr:DUF4390 domain-containing protein [Acidobacteriota bacterium]MBI3264740.1 DUF4390 domain-containing protein [Acidobacteriota bacterium]